MDKDPTLLEKLESIVPGFRGYRYKELQREDDELIRRKVSSILDDARARVERLIPVMRKKNISVALRLDDLRLELMKASQMIKHADYGHSGLFDRESVEEKELQALLEYDYKLVTQASKIIQKVVELSMLVDQRELMEKVNSAIAFVQQLEDSIRERERLVKGSVAT